MRSRGISWRPRTWRLTRRRRNALAATAAVILFSVALIAWIGSPPPPLSSAAMPGAPSASVSPSPVSPSSVSPSSVSPSAPASGSRPSPVPSFSFSVPPSLAGAFPASSLDSEPGGLPVRAVTITVTSDTQIAGVGYLVANGDPSRYSAYWVKSPFVVHTYGRSGGAVAFVAAQGGPTATYVTCTLEVDGQRKSQHTATGANAFTTCFG